MKEDPKQHMRRLFQRLGTREFQNLLDEMLYDLKFMGPCQSEGDMALNNYAKELLAKVYADESGKVDSGRLHGIIRRLVRRKKKRG